MRLGWLLLGLLLAVESGLGAVLVSGEATWQWMVSDVEPESSLPGIWREPEHVPSQPPWLVGLGPFVRGGVVGGTQVPADPGALMARTSFVLANSGQYFRYRMAGAVEGGAVVWLNGVEVWRDGVAAGVDSPGASPVAGATSRRDFVVEFERADLPSLHPGTNVLAVQLLPGGASAPVYWAVTLEGEVDLERPSVVRIEPPPGSAVSELVEIDVLFSEPVIGVDASDLLVNGVPAVAVTPVAADQYSFTVPAVQSADVRVEFLGGSGITDRAIPGNMLRVAAWAYAVGKTGGPEGVILSEFMADNDRTLRDENGDDVDWIELHNPSARDVALKDWGLSDDRGQPFKWRFPDVVLPSRGFLLVYASEKNRTNVPGRLHTNFKLDASGEYLGLTDAAGTVVSEFAPRYPAQRKDVSYGRAPGASETVGYFDRATPGAANAASGSGFAPGVVMSRPSGTYSGSITVELALASPDTNAVIRYTVDRTMPGGFSPVYTGPLTLTNATHLRARAFSPGKLPGPPASETYIPLSSGVAQFRSDLPVLLLHNFGRGRPSTSGGFGVVQLFEPVDGVTSLTNAPTLVTRSLLGSRGSSTEGLAKVSLKVEFRDEFDLDRELPWLGMPEESDWVLYAPNQYDPIMIHNPFMHTLSRDLGYYSSRTRFVEVYLVTSGMGAVATTAYNGVYVLEEKIKRDNNRVDVDELKPEHTAEPEVTGGYLFKVDRADPGDTGFSAAGVTMMYVEPKEPEIERPDRLAQRQYVGRFFQQFGAALNGVNFRDPVNGYARYLDVGPSVDFHILNTVAFNVDALVLSTYLHKPRGGKLTFGPQWDFDRALGSTDGRDANPRTWGANYFSAYWWPRLFADPDFTQRWIDRYQEMRRGHLSLSNVHARIDRLTGELRQAQPRERAKWGTPYRGGSYAGEILHMKTWMSNRLDFIDTRFVPSLRVEAPVLDAVAGRIQYRLRPPTNLNTIVYYTTNGTDPRLPGGLVSPSALLYQTSSPPVFDRNTRVIARAYSTVARPGTPNSRWGGPAEASLVVRRPALRFSEVHFKPSVDGDREFLEVFNPSEGAVVLDGWTLAGGVQFVFGGTNALKVLGPGERCVVVGDLVAFGVPPAGVLMAGQYTGRLSNEADRVELRGPVGELVDVIEYDAQRLPLANGGGWSLVPVSEGRLDVTAWRLSAFVGGSPGAADPASGAGPGGDLDADGLPDVWERRYGLIVGEAAFDRGVDDRDGDGVTNAGEFRAGTDPTLALSVQGLEAVLDGSGRVRLRWNRIPGRGARLLARDGWDGAERVVGVRPPLGTTGWEEVIEETGEGDRLYRLGPE